MNQRFKIVNWKKYQHYKDRRPPWIKLYSKLLRKYEFLCLQDDSKLLLILLWLFASTLESNDPQVPADTQYLKSVLPFNGKINLQPLIQYGFIEMIADCKQNDSTLQATCTPYKEETYTKETETETYIPEKTNVITPNEILGHWNSKARLPKIRYLSEKRKDSIRLRAKESFFVENWKEAIDKLDGSDFCTGNGNGGWKATIDFLIANDNNIVKIIEGKYDKPISTRNGQRIIKDFDTLESAYGISVEV